MRLDKYLCDMGLGTRSEVKNYMRKGLVTVDGEVIRKPETQVDKNHAVCFNGQRVDYVAMEYFMLNKPQGCVSASSDKKCETVLDLIETKNRKDLFPVGRLDKDTEGLLLITNDGDLAHNLLSPKKHVDKVYFARIEGNVTEDHVKLFAEGVDIGEERLTLPAELRILKSGEVSEIELTIREGKFHQVKRMFEAIGCEVTYLKRLSMGKLVLDGNLEAGTYRSLTEDEIAILKEYK